MDRKVKLRAIFKLMLLFGLTAVAYPFLSSLSTGPEQKNNTWVTCDVSTLDEGNILRCGYATIYKRTRKDFATINKHELLLSDARSENSRQPEKATNPWRSENPAYFIFMPWAPVKGCAITLVRGKTHFTSPVPEMIALDELPYLTEPCANRTWDMSGRLYERSSYPVEKNLFVPKVRWEGNTRVHVRQNVEQD